MDAQACDRHLTFRNGSLRCALFPENKIPPAAFTKIAGPSGVGALRNIAGPAGRMFLAEK